MALGAAVGASWHAGSPLLETPALDEGAAIDAEDADTPLLEAPSEVAGDDEEDTTMLEDGGVPDDEDAVPREEDGPAPPLEEDPPIEVEDKDEDGAACD